MGERMPKFTILLKGAAAYLFMTICLWHGWGQRSDLFTTALQLAFVLICVGVLRALLEEFWALCLKHYWMSRITYEQLKKKELV